MDQFNISWGKPEAGACVQTAQSLVLAAAQEVLAAMNVFGGMMERGVFAGGQEGHLYTVAQAKMAQARGQLFQAGNVLKCAEEGMKK
jgi:hypothetical protein